MARSRLVIKSRKEEGGGSTAVDLEDGDVESLRPRADSLEEEEKQNQNKPETASLGQTVKTRRSHAWLTKLPFCYILIATGLLGLATSLVLSLWWSFLHNDVSGGFTIGSYVIAFVSFLVAVPGYRHSMTCTCWIKDNDAGLGTS